jgi:hypothetical protein
MDEISSGDYKGRTLAQLEMSVNVTLFTHEFLILASILDTHIRLPRLVKDLEREVLDIGLHLCIIEFAADEAFGVEDTMLDGMR